ncbi:hypothetical protein COW36_05775 [bacterium (Candidatus Blackallbacteria) CG17_big_fil_post_rev_8_21_14_2_50_48_46]|uniref:Uncharacterized protein n=1 Tax=bacterium (Candidatus Blackallbacteria) CG17_big_fil_post_rev_8_21_14_2_50_48_46 TaxID=2014261 RepID=A0A2M7G859_9BACT|nr:MAG: hypothetical protein COW64_21370 [bacterium (Candidatus Blackallbacteria) CG18_big_fil_WC_8_21_14_2_50_49_26]PIW18276.1 MAG: hypothetical protein COW36_05775 [bacterium (Candidatus Blackallbacteria) CG17_big_fil_post_rev_8_21_14_2_50_48_46]PIW49500.1 MAG: hypothetical protein COW20_05590 [bacterium (Candidatus Blackallbacteria) CG13_big_fil_rev_8_21_14_2_50_49_14]
MAKLLSPLVYNASLAPIHHLVVRQKQGTIQEHFVHQKSHPQLYDFITRLLEKKCFDTEMAARLQTLSLEDQSWLQESQLLLPPDQVPEQVFFHCPLDLHFPDLMPHHSKAAAQRLPIQSKQLTINPRMVLQTEAELDPVYAERVPFREVFSAARPILWVRETRYETLVPYWPTAAMLPIIHSLMQGQIPQNLSEETLQVLILARILLPGSLQENLEQQAQVAEETKAFLAEKHYAEFPELLNPIQLAAMRKYYREIQNEGYMHAENSADVNRVFAHNDPLTCYLHFQISAWINKITPEPVIPTYTFVSYYEKTGMGRHIDWEQCAWNISLMVDPQPEEEPTQTWPLCIEFPEQTLETRLLSGDAVIYQGTDYYHWRDPLPEGHKATVSLFHFMPNPENKT